MTSPGHEKQGSPRQQKKLFQALFDHLPADPDRRLAALDEINHSFRQVLADQLQPVVRTLLQESPPANGDGKIELAKRLNHILRDAGLAIVGPNGEPAIVIAESFRLRLQCCRERNGRQIVSSNVKTLPPLELMEHIRQEPFNTWRERAERDRRPDEHLR